MDIKWMEDFLALVKHGSFTKAAEVRNVTQPGFSRRIRSLEHWLGVDLVDRNVFPTKLTKAGEDSLQGMRHSLSSIYELRAKLQESAAHEKMLILSTQHSLSISFFPKWYQKVKSAMNNIGVRVNASDLHDCLVSFLEGQSDLLLCYFSPDIYPELERLNISGLEIGSEYLLPVCASNSALCSAAPANSSCIEMVGFPSESFFGRIIRQHCLPKIPVEQRFKLICETAQSDSVKGMVSQGIGMSWLPATVVEEDLARGELVQIPNLPTYEMKVMLYRQATARTPEVEKLWQSLSQEKY
ncbi:MAG: LysR family transcriptional regulator [Oceanospirillaceae bacterium]